MTRKTIEDLFIHSLSDIYGAQPCPAHRSHQTYPQRGGYAASLVRRRWTTA